MTRFVLYTLTMLIWYAGYAALLSGWVPWHLGPDLAPTTARDWIKLTIVPLFGPALLALGRLTAGHTAARRAVDAIADAETALAALRTGAAAGSDEADRWTALAELHHAAATARHAATFELPDAADTALDALIVRLEQAADGLKRDSKESIRRGDHAHDLRAASERAADRHADALAAAANRLRASLD